MESDKTVNYIKIARQIEKHLGCKIYIVGGYVRDKILKFKSVDLDFVVDGDGLEVAEELQKKLGGKLTIYKKFLTASLKLKNNFVIDIATARTEKYSSTAAMPVVKPAKLKKDLLRRDFTINALALPLITRYSLLANIIDVSGGLDDLKNKLIRVLHKKSFTDDPTRILRAIRYSNRFNFKIEKNTEKWMKQAIKKNLLALVSPPRIRDEFIKTLEEKNAKKILTEFKKRKILKYIDTKLDISAISPNNEPLKTRLKKLIGNFTNEQKKSFLQKLCLPAKIS
ncbi:MAG: hypothetical protein CVU80_00100 [Elusimicrobia bacterium HGW-Elusimicrobia-4]|nr:MAG: hypothetical protein CVU80_00100 [Elusimicrobia bacterium HGW-Elusimicrobia-4]